MEMASVFIKSAIESLLNAHASANMHRSSGNKEYMETVPANLENAMLSIKAAMSDAKNHINNK